MRICREYGWKFILTFKEGRSPDAYEMACGSMEVSKGSCGTLVVRGENQRKVGIGVVAWTGGIKFTTQSEGEEFHVVACEETDGGLVPGDVRHELRHRRRGDRVGGRRVGAQEVEHRKVSDGCRKMAQYEWVELLMRMMHEVGIREDFRSVPRRYLRRMDL